MTIAVVYDRGAASAAEIAVGLAGVAPLMFLVPPSAHNDRLAPVLGQLGQVVGLTGDPIADAATVAGHGPSAILTFSESRLRFTAEVAAAVGLDFHDVRTTRLLTEKSGQRLRLRESGVDDVRSSALSTMEEWPSVSAAVGLPAVVKPVRGEGSRNTHVIIDDDTAARLLPEVLAAAGVLQVEELLEGAPGLPLGDYVSVESLCGPDGVTHFAVTGKFPLVAPFREPGQFWPAPLSTGERSAVLDLTTGALTALGVRTGITHTEIKLTRDGPRIIEVNGRIGGHVNELAQHAAGVDLIRLSGRAALGHPVELSTLDDVDRVCFQHSVMAPTEPCRFVGTDGDHTVRKLPGVVGYRPFARPGDDLPGGVLTQELDMLWGECPDYDAMLHLVEHVTSTLTYRFAFPDGIRAMTGTDLMR